MVFCLLPKHHFLLPQLGTGYWPRGLLCLSSREFLVLSFPCLFPPDPTYFLQHAHFSFRRLLVGDMWWTVWDGMEKDYVGHLYWRRSCLVLSWMVSLLSGPVALLAPAQQQTLQAWIHVTCTTQSRCMMKRWSDGPRPAEQGKQAGAGWSHSAHETRQAHFSLWLFLTKLFWL